MPKGVGYGKKAKKIHKKFKASEKKKIEKHYQTRGADPGNPKPYVKSAAGKAAHKRARKGKTASKSGY